MGTALRRYGNPKTAPQSQGLRGQVPNSAGGFSFPLDNWKRLRRFLIMGTDGGTYYIREPRLTKENIEVLEECADEDPERVLAEIEEVYQNNLAPKSEYALFALAYMTAHPNENVRKTATGMIPGLHIGTHLFQFAEFVEMFRGWGSALRKGVAQWYLSRTPRTVAYQVTKYQQRNGWSHRDLLRLSHPKTKPGVIEKELNHIFRYVTQGTFQTIDNDFGDWPTDGLEYLGAAETAKTADKNETIELINRYNLTREMINTEYLSDIDVQKALVRQMPLNALVRNLGNLTRLGVFHNWSPELSLVLQRLTDERIVTKSRIHPVNVLNAIKTYESGRGFRGSNSWRPNTDILTALNRTFRLAFKNVTPSNTKTLIAVDTSGSMDFTAPAGFDNLSCKEAAAAMAMVTYESEPFVQVMAFSHQLLSLPLTRGMDLASVSRLIDGARFNGGTDCSLPMTYALHEGLDIDTFVVYTDNETWAGWVHPHIALQEYRNKMQKPDAKLIVVGMNSNGFSIADPTDEGMLDVVGFDSSAPRIISQFAAGKL